MNTTTLKEARKLVEEHVEVLRGYAHRSLVQGEALSFTEMSDKESRINEFRAMGSCLKLTENEMVTMVYQDMLRERRRCGCPTCRSRSASQQ